MNDELRLECCYMDNGGIGCSADATYEIYVIGGDFYDTTHTCDAHLVAMLTDADRHELITLPKPEKVVDASIP